MPRPKNAMEIFQRLDKSNCRDCGEKTCLAFAGAVFKGQKRIEECPKLDRATIDRFSEPNQNQASGEQDQDDVLLGLKKKIAAVDLTAAAVRTGGCFSDGKLTLKVLGKDVSIDSRGNFSADIHINPWVVGPYLIYVLTGKGLPISGNWVSFRELQNGKERYPLFQKRCEEVLKNVADTYTDLFDDMVHIFNGRQVDKQFRSDISVVLYPLPKVPVMVCYWLPEDGIESSLNLFFDETANENIGVDALFTLGAGFAQMFAKLSLRHGYSTSNTLSE
jgi:hypothetical protein